MGAWGFNILDNDSSSDAYDEYCDAMNAGLHARQSRNRLWTSSGSGTNSLLPQRPLHICQHLAQLRQLLLSPQYNRIPLHLDHLKICPSDLLLNIRHDCLQLFAVTRDLDRVYKCWQNHTPQNRHPELQFSMRQCDNNRGRCC